VAGLCEQYSETNQFDTLAAVGTVNRVEVEVRTCVTNWKWEVQTEFGGNLKVSGQLGYIELDVRIILKQILGKYGLR
jgi:hypothetical protein